jgi:hypothetical protein
VKDSGQRPAAAAAIEYAGLGRGHLERTLLAAPGARPAGYPERSNRYPIASKRHSEHQPAMCSSYRTLATLTEFPGAKLGAIRPRHLATSGHNGP